MEKIILVVLEKMKIKLNKKFYNKKAVKEALDKFKGVCAGEIINNDMMIELEEDDKDLEKEFCNYVLGLMKNKHQV